MLTIYIEKEFNFNENNYTKKRNKTHIHSTPHKKMNKKKKDLNAT